MRYPREGAMITRRLTSLDRASIEPVSRAQSFTFGFSILSFLVLIVIGLAAPNAASAQEGMESLVASPSRLNFGTVTLGTTSSPQTATITSDFLDDNVQPIVSFIGFGFVLTNNT